MKSTELREKIYNHAVDYANQMNLDYCKVGSAVIFKNNGNSHGNFHNESFTSIMSNQKWKDRLSKTHTHPSVPVGTMELDSCHSSDALLMNVFCYPKITSWSGICNLFKVSSINIIEFGHKACVKLKNGLTDATEIDLYCEEFIVESKLTEEGFTSKEKSIVENYIDFETTFHTSFLRQSDQKYNNYQLIRNILAAKQLNTKFFLICDYRRSDLVKAFIETIVCIQDISLRNNCGIVFWQDITEYSGEELKVFLKSKYGF